MLVMLRANSNIWRQLMETQKETHRSIETKSQRIHSLEEVNTLSELFDLNLTYFAVLNIYFS